MSTRFVLSDEGIELVQEEDRIPVPVPSVVIIEDCYCINCLPSTDDEPPICNKWTNPVSRVEEAMEYF